MKKSTLFVTFLIIIFSTQLKAQFTPEKSYLTPCLGFSWHGSTPEFGLNYEYSFGKELKNFGVGGLIRYLSYGKDYSNGTWNYSYTYLGGQFNYHIKIDDQKIDPFFGLTLGYNIYSSSWDGVGHHDSDSESSGLFIAAHATFRYWISSKLGISGRLNFGNGNFGAIDFGVDFKL
jgi:hypothetical protein